MSVVARSEQRRGDEGPLAAVLAGAPRCTAALRSWADTIDARVEKLSAHEADLTALAAHTEQLSAEIDRSRPGAPVRKNAEDALKKAVGRTAKVLRDVLSALDALSDAHAPNDAFGKVFASAENDFDVAKGFVYDYMAGCHGYEAEADAVAPPAEKKERKEKNGKEAKDKKRSNSPRRKSAVQSP